MSQEPNNAGLAEVDPLQHPSLTLNAVRDSARKVLAAGPDAVVRYRLLRDVLEEKGDALRALRRALKRSPHVKALRAGQRADGGWGGLHSATEHAVERALVLGLDATDPMVRTARDYLASLLLGRRPFPEMERNERALHGWSTFAVA